MRPDSRKTNPRRPRDVLEKMLVISGKQNRLRDTAGIVVGNFVRRFLRLDLVVDFSAMNRNLPGSLNSETHVIATDFDHRDDDVIPDDYVSSVFRDKTSMLTHRLQSSTGPILNGTKARR